MESKKNLKILSEIEIDASLAQLPGWFYSENRIKKEFAFNSFKDALSFVNQLASFFERVDHHADMRISYKKILFELTTNNAGEKVTDIDFMVALEIEKDFLKLKKIKLA